MSKELIVQAVFGQFAVEINGVVELFETESEAKTAGVLAANEGEFKARAAAYCEARGLEDKNAKGKTNVITDFLAFEASVAGDEVEA